MPHRLRRARPNRDDPQRDQRAVPAREGVTDGPPPREFARPAPGGRRGGPKGSPSCDRALRADDRWSHRVAHRRLALGERRGIAPTRARAARRTRRRARRDRHGPRRRPEAHSASRPRRLAGARRSRQPLASRSMRRPHTRRAHDRRTTTLPSEARRCDPRPRREVSECCGADGHGDMPICSHACAPMASAAAIGADAA